MRLAYDDPTAEWLAQRLEAGRRVLLVVHPCQEERAVRVFAGEPLVRVLVSRYADKERWVFADG